MHTDELDQEKKRIDEVQTATSEYITEADLAAGVDEGMDSQEGNPLTEDVAEDRDATPPAAIE